MHLQIVAVERAEKCDVLRTVARRHYIEAQHFCSAGAHSPSVTISWVIAVSLKNAGAGSALGIRTGVRADPQPVSLGRGSRKSFVSPMLGADNLSIAADSLMH